MRREHHIVRNLFSKILIYPSIYKAGPLRLIGPVPLIPKFRLSSFFLFFCASIRHYFPKRIPTCVGNGQRHKPQMAFLRHRSFTSARIAGGSPHCLIRLCRAVAGLKYHCRLPGLLRYNPPWAVFRSDGFRSSPYLAVLYGGYPSAGGPGASPSSLFLTDRQLTYLCLWLFSFQSSLSGIRRSPLTN